MLLHNLNKLTVMGEAREEEENGDVEILFLSGNSLPEDDDVGGDCGDAEIPDFVLRRRAIFEGGEGRNGD